MDRKETSETVVSTNTDDEHPNDNNERPVLIKDLAKFGNGLDGELSEEQIGMIFQLKDDVREPMKQLQEKTIENKENHEWFTQDLDVYRRYLVARQWNLKAAETQLLATIEWRQQDSTLNLQFHQSPLASQNPYAMSMRIIGVDKDGRPICFTSFAQSNDRWNVDANIAHMTLLMESCCQMIYNRLRLNGTTNNNETASSRQWIFVIDFDGFAMKDAANPKSGVLTAKLLQNYPELMNMVILLNSPYLFSGMYALIKPFLDDRVKSKINFVSGRTKTKVFTEELQRRLGENAVNWIWDEIQDNYMKQKSSAEKKQYWIPPNSKSQHDSRGMEGYVDSEFYVKTPGDAYYMAQQQTQEQ